jgi:hypothetical protein
MSRSLAVFSPGDESADKASVLYSLGWVAHRNRRFAESAACFDRSAELFGRLGMRVSHERAVATRHRLGLSVPSR